MRKRENYSLFESLSEKCEIIIVVFFCFRIFTRKVRKSYLWFTVFVVFESLTLFRKFYCIATLPRLFSCFLCSDLFISILYFMVSFRSYIYYYWKKKNIVVFVATWQRWQRFFRKVYYLKKDFIIFVKIRKNRCHRCHVATRWKLELLISFKKIKTY